MDRPTRRSQYPLTPGILRTLDDTSLELDAMHSSHLGRDRHDQAQENTSHASKCGASLVIQDSESVARAPLGTLQPAVAGHSSPALPVLAPSYSTLVSGQVLLVSIRDGVVHCAANPKAAPVEFPFPSPLRGRFEFQRVRRPEVIHSASDLRICRIVAAT